MFYHILFVNKTILLYVGFYGLYTGYGFFFVDRSPSCRYSIPFKIIIEVISVYFFAMMLSEPYLFTTLIGLPSRNALTLAATCLFRRLRAS